LECSFEPRPCLTRYGTIGNRRYVRRNVSRSTVLSLGAGNEARHSCGHGDPSFGSDNASAENDRRRVPCSAPDDERRRGPVPHVTPLQRAPCAQARKQESSKTQVLSGLCSRGSLQGRLRRRKVSPRRSTRHSGIGLSHESLGRLARARGGLRSPSFGLARCVCHEVVRDTHRLTRRCVAARRCRAAWSA
jgi:hypothetical protein